MPRQSSSLLITALIATALLSSACQTTGGATEAHSRALLLDQSSLQLRQVQSRRFDTADETMILRACSAVMQDLGFSVEEISRETGMLVGSKERDAIEAGQVAGQLFLAALVAAFGGQADPVWDQNQRIRISIITRPAGQNAINVRATFQRVIWNSKNQVSRVETLDSPVMYQEFYDKVSQAVFLEAHEL